MDSMKDIEVGSFVVLNNGATIIIEEINGVYFFGIDNDREEYTVTIDQIMAVIG